MRNCEQIGGDVAQLVGRKWFARAVLMDPVRWKRRHINTLTYAFAKHAICIRADEEIIHHFLVDLLHRSVALLP